MIQNDKMIVALHVQAKKISVELQKKESEFISLLQQIDQFKVYRAYKYPSLFKYVVLALGFSESRAYDFITVARAGLKFEKLNKAIKENKISVSKARRIVPILDDSNQEEWLKRVNLMSHRQIEKLVAERNPEVVSCESYRYVSEKQIEVKIVVTEAEFQELKRAQELLCQKEKKHVGLKGAVVRTVREFIKREDPVVKAARVLSRKIDKVDEMGKTREINEIDKIDNANPNQSPNQLGTCRVEKTRSQGERPKENQWTNQEGGKLDIVRQSIPAFILHQVNYRDRGQCQASLPHGELCLEKKWVDIHHIQHVKDGGQNTLENLVTLCKGHHQIEHA